jgi:cell division protein ZapA (FtsZ GTPase activity inhibitor)
VLFTLEQVAAQKILMKEQHISVIIADRPYRLKVLGEKEEEQCRKAKDLINSKMKDYADNFAFRDKQDLLAMVALQFAVDVVKSEELSQFSEKLNERLSKIDTLLDDYLNE